MTTLAFLSLSFCFCRMTVMESRGQRSGWCARCCTSPSRSSRARRSGRWMGTEPQTPTVSVPPPLPGPISLRHKPHPALCSAPHTPGSALQTGWQLNDQVCLKAPFYSNLLTVLTGSIPHLFYINVTKIALNPFGAIQAGLFAKHN